MNVVWSQTAVDTYLHVTDYIFTRWTQREVANFQTAVDSLLDRIMENNHLCPESKLLGYRKCVVSKQTSLIYSVKNNFILLVTFIDSKTDHKF